MCVLEGVVESLKKSDKFRKDAKDEKLDFIL